jgi:hypothetical protein
LLEGPNIGTTTEIQNPTDDELHSDVDSDFGLDYNAIKYLTGDIAKNSLGNDGVRLWTLSQHPKTKKGAK